MQAICKQCLEQLEGLSSMESLQGQTVPSQYAVQDALSLPVRSPAPSCSVWLLEGWSQDCGRAQRERDRAHILGIKKAHELFMHLDQPSHLRVLPPVGLIRGVSHKLCPEGTLLLQAMCSQSAGLVPAGIHEALLTCWHWRADEGPLQSADTKRSDLCLSASLQALSA